jgi:uncharacterized protein (TIGR02453 family)
MFDPHAVVAYLAELKENNNKPWFDANKPRFQALRKDFSAAVEEVILALAEDDDRLQGVSAESCLFRIHRDIRFSKDKTPYKTNFSAAPGAKSGRGPGYYFEITAEGAWGAGAGAWMPEPAEATLIRQAIVTRPSVATAILDDPALKAAFPNGIWSESYKRPPKGFDENSPRLDLVMRKGYALWNDAPIPAGMTGSEFTSLISQTLRASVPWVGFLREAMRVP